MHKGESRTIVVKYGGNAMTDESLKLQVIKNICLMQQKGCQVVVIHGGGPFIKAALAEANINSEFIDGHRKTSPEAFRYVERELKGNVNSNIVGIINKLGYMAVGLSGKDGKLVTAVKRQHRKVVNGQEEIIDLGQVGDVVRVDTRLLGFLLDQNYIPVLTCIAQDNEGWEYNINADMFAGHVAGALQAEEYIVLTDVDGLLADKDDPQSLLNEVNIAETGKLIDNKTILGGMLPKIESCIIALEKGAKAARILNGTKPEQLIGVMNGQKTGTIIKK